MKISEITPSIIFDLLMTAKFFSFLGQEIICQIPYPNNLLRAISPITELCIIQIK